MSDKKILQIDVRGILNSKNPKLAQRIPGFIIRYLKRIVHQDEINLFLQSVPEKKDMDFVNDIIKFMELKVEFEGFDKVPDSGRFVFASNHPLGGLESIVLMQVVSRKHPDFVFVVNDILMALEPMSGLFVPVNKVGSQSRESVDRVNSAYLSDKQILFFPAGLVSRKIKGKIVDLEWQKSFVKKAVQTQRDIIPVYIDGRNSNFFYRLAKLRKFFGIKVNIEMLYLVDEAVKQRGRTIKINFGSPISYKKIDKSKSFLEWAEYIKKLAYSQKS
jgi:putative hemolysin